jgi:sugar transferase (PEP-CTERM/EpsH1 system associated)
MRILQITPRIPYPPDDGGKIGIFNITKYLSMRGHKITLLSLDSIPVKDMSGLEKFCNVEPVFANTSNSYLKMFLNLFSPSPYTMSKYYIKDFETKLYNLLKKNRFDIVHIDSLHMAYYGKMIKSYFNIPIVLREHNVESVIWERYYQESSNLLKKIYAGMQFKKVYKYESKILEVFDKCLMITKEDEKRIKQMNPKIKTAVVPAGVDTSKFFPMDIPEEPYSIVSVASMDWMPNIDGVIWFYKKIFPKIKREIPSAKLYIVGKNPPLEIKNIVDKNVIVTGYVEDVREYIAKAAVFIVPLKVGGGMRIKILNALAMSKAIVSTSVGCEGIEVTDGKNICVANREEDFARKIIELMLDREKRERIGKNGLELIRKKYTWEKMASLIEEEYIKLTRDVRYYE